MIKRFRIAPPDPGGGGADPWEAAAGAARTAGPDVRPVRVAACRLVEELSVDPPCRAIGIEWFDDPGHMERFDDWVLAQPEAGAGGSAFRDGPGGPAVVVAEELIMRGADWLEQRWRAGGPVLKQMALATRAEGLTQAEFSERWKGRAGTVSTSAGTTVPIPDQARGKAYIQNHPCPGEWPYDALNEVFFDDEAALRARIEWFAEHMQRGAEKDLVSGAHFVVFRESPVG